MRLGFFDDEAGWPNRRHEPAARALDDARRRIAAELAEADGTPDGSYDVDLDGALACRSLDDAANAVADVAGALAVAASPDAGPLGPAGLVVDQVAELTAAAARAAERAAAATVLAAVEADRRGLPGLDGRSGLKAWLRRRCALGTRDAGRYARLARFVHRHPLVGTALADGTLSTAHLGAIVDAVPADRHDLFDETWTWLADAARGLDPDQLATLMRTWRLHADQDRPPTDPASTNQLRTWVGPDGVGHLDATLDAEAWEIVLAALELHDRPDPTDALLPPRSRGSRLADQLLHMARAWLGSEPSAQEPTTETPDTPDASGGATPARPATPRPSATINAFLDVAALDPELLAQLGRADLLALRCELERFGPILPTTAQRLTCNGYLSRLLTARSVTLDMGFRTPTFTEAQRRAIVAEFPTCPCGCGTPASQCDIHHIEPYDPERRRGPTDHANGVPLCRRVHILTHEGVIRPRRLGPGTVVFLRC
ncbi:MAG: hypothetical protein KDB36_07360 [Acidimicrobiales bacterium]|nr:hypothetical protein [Acidimicrobiales bacterium]